MTIPCELDAGNVAAAHAELVAALDQVEAAPKSARLRLEGDGAPSPLTLQLLVSAARSFPEGKLHLDPPAAEALAPFSPKET